LLPDAPANEPGVVVTDLGRVRGVPDGGAWAWRGIPYAAPPVGPLRWRPPQPAASWTDVRDASTAGKVCLQGALPPATGIAGDEDCLTLQVFAPSAPTGPLPVIVFAHGGDWIEGSGSWPLYDGAYVAEHGPAVVVTINYRLGALGFLAHTGLAAEDAHGSTGNYGLLDQVAALGWVQRNAAAFGGDPTRVLFWGQSAGGWSTLMHLASPIARGLFSRAFSESGGTYAQAIGSAEANGTAYANALGCGTASDIPACLRALPGSTVALPAPETAWDPVIDGYVLTEPVATTFARGAQTQIPLIVGTTSLEYAGGLMPAKPPITAVVTATDFQAAIQQLFPAYASQVLARYPVATYPTPRAAYVGVLDDWGMLCPTRRIARAIAGSQTAPVWRYVYAHADSSGALVTRGPSHAVDLPFWFHTFSAVQGFTPNATELGMSDTMISYLVRFAATGNPNSPGLATWNPYDTTTDPYMVLDDEIYGASGMHSVQCDFWDAP
jgi:para-nitrobenzyl esterase